MICSDELLDDGPEYTVIRLRPFEGNYAWQEFRFDRKATTYYRVSDDGTFCVGGFMEFDCPCAPCLADSPKN